MSSVLLQVDQLAVDIGPVRIVDGISFQISAGETYALLGESGCGKSITALSLMRLLPDGGRIAAGTVNLGGENILALPERDMRRVRGGGMAMIFQEPMLALNPVIKVGEQIAEALVLHQGLARAGDTGRGACIARRRGRTGCSAATRQLSVRAIGRLAPAGDDRDGAGWPAQTADCRRADHGARRDHPGAGARRAAPPARRPPDGHAADHARPRRGGGKRRPRGRDVRRRTGGGGRARCFLCNAAASLQPHAVRRAAAPR